MYALLYCVYSRDRVSHRIHSLFLRRYVAICHPFISHTMSKLSRAVKFVVVIWVLALCLAVPQAIQFGVIYDYVDGTTNLDSARCSLRWTLIEHAFEISTILFFVLPMTIITVLYVLIGIKLRRSRLLTATVKRRNHALGGSDHVDSSRGKTAAQRNVIRMLGKRTRDPWCSRIAATSSRANRERLLSISFGAYPRRSRRSERFSRPRDISFANATRN